METDPAPGGERATATVLARTSPEPADAEEEQRREYTYALRVEPREGTPFETRVRHAFWLLELKPSVGDRGVGVRFDPSTKVTTFDLGGDPRYDADALIARTATHRRAR
jgi:hypothetical protein